MFTQKEELKGTFCPLIRKDCVREKCVWWAHVIGQNPQTGGQIDHYGCAVTWIPVLQIETTQMVRGSQAATESFRNLIANGMEETRRLNDQNKY